MSTDELVRGIRRIVGDRDAKPTGLADAEARKAIGISRGIGFIRSDGTVGGGGAEGGGNDTSPPDVPTDQPDSGGGVPADAGGTTGGGDAGGKTVLDGDAADVDDATVDNTVLGTVTGTDPGTGNLTSVKFDSLAGIEYTPPDGWSDLSTPPDYTPGTFWRVSPTQILGSFHKSYTEELSATSVAVALGSPPYVFKTGGTWYFLNSRSPTGPGGVFFDGTYLDGTSAAPGFFHSGGTGNVSIIQESCSLDPTNTPCTVPYTPDWPSDSTCQVVYDHDAGGYKGNDKDPDCSAAQKTAADFVILRSQSDPSRYFRYTRLANGGTKVTEVDSGGVPKPGTVTKLLDGQGNVTGFVDVSLDAFYQ